jgi:hypothetical protein
MHDDIWILVFVVAIANVGGKGLVIENVGHWGGAECWRGCSVG